MLGNAPRSPQVLRADVTQHAALLPQDGMLRELCLDGSHACRLARLVRVCVAWPAAQRPAWVAGSRNLGFACPTHRLDGSRSRRLAGAPPRARHDSQIKAISHAVRRPQGCGSGLGFRAQAFLAKPFTLGPGLGKCQLACDHKAARAVSASTACLGPGSYWGDQRLPTVSAFICD
jgi:hypothetical protein